MKKKLSFFLAIVMILSLLPMTAFAASSSVINVATGGQDDVFHLMTNAPMLQMQVSQPTVGAASSVSYDLTNAEWNFDGPTGTPVIPGINIDGQAYGGFKYFVGTDANGANSIVGVATTATGTGLNPKTGFKLTAIGSAYGTVEFGTFATYAGTETTYAAVAAEFSNAAFAPLATTYNSASFYIPLPVKATADDGVATVDVGNIMNGFSDAQKYTIINLSGSSAVIKVAGADSQTGKFNVKQIYISDRVGTVFKSGTNTVTLTAPRGYEWSVNATAFTGTGDLLGLTSPVATPNTSQKNKLNIAFSTPAGYAHVTGGTIVFPDSSFSLVPSDDATVGDIMVDVKVNDKDPVAVKVGAYVDFGATYTLTDNKVSNLTAGAWDADKNGQEITKTVVLEDLSKFQWSNGKTVKFNISDNAEILSVKAEYTKFDTGSGSDDGTFVTDSANISNGSLTSSTDTVVYSRYYDASADKNYDGKGKTDNSAGGHATMTVAPSQISISGFTGTAAAKLKLTLRVRTLISTTDDVTLTTNCPAVNGEKTLTIATVKAPITVTFKPVENARLAKGLVAGDIVITENFAGAISSGSADYLKFTANGYANGVKVSDDNKVVISMDNPNAAFGAIRFTDADVKVTSGDAVIDDNDIKDGNIWFRLKYASSKTPSVITISNVVYGVSRLTYVGSYDALVKGTAINPSGDYDDFDHITLEKYINVSDDALVASNSTVTQVAQGSIDLTNSTWTDAEGTTAPLDQAVLNANGRTLVPLRAISQMLGVPNDADHIIWNQAQQSATIIYNGHRLVFVVGQPYYVNNEVTNNVDVAPVNKDGHVYVPVRYIAEGLGGVVNYNAAANTGDITMPAVEAAK